MSFWDTGKRMATVVPPLPPRVPVPAAVSAPAELPDAPIPRNHAMLFLALAGMAMIIALFAIIYVAVRGGSPGTQGAIGPTGQMGTVGQSNGGTGPLGIPGPTGIPGSISTEGPTGPVGTAGGAGAVGPPAMPTTSGLGSYYYQANGNNLTSGTGALISLQNVAGTPVSYINGTDITFDTSNNWFVVNAGSYRVSWYFIAHASSDGDPGTISLRITGGSGEVPNLQAYAYSESRGVPYDDEHKQSMQIYGFAYFALADNNQAPYKIYFVNSSQTRLTLASVDSLNTAMTTAISIIKIGAT